MHQFEGGGDWPVDWAAAYRPSSQEGSGEQSPPDEVMWGDLQTTTFVTAGTGPTAQTIRQLIQVQRPAKEWTLNLAFALPGVMALPTLPNFSVRVTFTVTLGLGRSKIQRYEELFSADLIGFAPDPAFPFQIQTPTTSRTVPNLPAEVVIVGAHVLYDRILLAAPATLVVEVAAGVAPVVR